MAVVHKHLIIRAEVGRPITEEQVAIEWMNKLVE